jgi:hypothetical protein
MANIYEKPRGWKRTIATALILFAVAAGFFYLAYVGMVTGTAIKTVRQYPAWVRWIPPADAGVYYRKYNPWQFWSAELFYTAFALFFMGSGLGTLWLEYKRRRHQKFLLSLPPDLRKDFE